MTINEDGCQSCLNMYKQFGESQCLFEPHDYRTLLQENIVKWLCSPFIDPWTDKGCPAWLNYKQKESK